MFAGRDNDVKSDKGNVYSRLFNVFDTFEIKKFVLFCLLEMTWRNFVIQTI